MDIKKELLLDGLHCAGCAAKIEDRVKKLEDVKDAVLNFATSTLTITADTEDILTVVEKTMNIVTDLEPHTKVIDKEILNHRSEETEVKCECGCCGNGHATVNKKLNTDAESNKQGYSVGDIGNNKKRLLKFGIGITFFILAKFFEKQNFSIFMYLASYLIIGGDILILSFRNILRGEVFDENFLMSAASIAAFSVGEYPEAVMVMFLYEIGEYFQERAVNSSRKSIASLMDIRPEYANLKIENDIKRVSPDKVNIGDIIIVKPGEKVPLDGVIIEGKSAVDTSALTGESIPRDVKIGESILSGFINISGLLTIKVDKSFKESAVSKILDLVQNAAAKKAKAEKFVTKFAKYYTPAVVIAALAIAILPPIIKGWDFSTWVYRAATFLVVSCPCALVISVPLGYFAGIGASSKAGILVKGGNYLEALTDVSVVVFDKTGTLTKGNFKVTDIMPKGNINEEELLKYTAYVESFSNHPIAKSITEEYKGELHKANIENYKEVTGNGVEAVVNGIRVASGNKNFIEALGIKCDEVNNNGTVVHTAIDDKYAGYIAIKDQIKKDSASGIRLLKKSGIKKIVMLTGDRKENAEAVAEKLKIDYVYSELLPHEKVDKVEELYNGKNHKEKLVFVGDGINDAPVLARADIGIAMGAVGSDAAIEAADIVIMNDEPSKLATVIRIAEKTKKIVMQNIVFTLSVKLLVLVLSAFGIASMWLAVFADVGVALIAVFNSMRILKCS
ncbi:heavy metal translocating P-type ATPase [Clostridium sp. ZS2-4]|uniref:heavy metal translocating P-type ATPase n=1 Tax=Clostridium sp. ZS2-4 TaxID=2987703 RepID=UPI00227A89C6|nr:heavy metal translocating P-type ATPase [Clostridium sp. ZS2-4]MCY6353735.1 heavy metal translocating P-type ATPase [Clostridium sp. ZS2-4]